MAFDSLEPTDPQSTTGERRGNGLRYVMDLLVSLAIAVIMFRAFEVEGYIISTGSMAPCLLGYHKRVRCPSCEYDFPFGVAFDDSDAAEASGDAPQGDSRAQVTVAGAQLATCPNCGRRGIDVSDVPQTEGDQLLVQKHTYSLRSPRRWEIVVFRSPNRPSQPYVKRIVGLPGESIQILRGDVVINGRVARKTLAEQRSLRIPVYDHSFEPLDEGWQDRWIPDGRWTREADGFRTDGPTDGENGDSWLSYEHWIRSGGEHETRVALNRWPEEVEVPYRESIPFFYDAQTRELVGVGALPQTLRDTLVANVSDDAFRFAIEELYRRSHIGPVADAYGYNRYAGIVPHNHVPDLMVALEITATEPTGEFAVEMTSEGRRFVCQMDFTADVIRLQEVGSGVILRDAPLPASLKTATTLVEMSLFDAQVLVAIDGKTILEPWRIDGGSPDAPSSTESSPAGSRIRFGVHGANLRLGAIRLFRDIHYTRGRALHGVEEPFQLGGDEFFMLGDNSPVSFDSRSWREAVVRRNQLLGKPFIVHLPSRAGRIRVGGYEGHIRIPDFARIRYIR